MDPEVGSRLDAAEEGCRTLGQRVERLEQELYHLRSIPSTSSLPTTTAGTTPSVPTHRPIGINPLFESTFAYQRIRHDETVFNMSSQNSYPDPIARGLVNMMEMELAYHLYVVPAHTWVSSRANVVPPGSSIASPCSFPWLLSFRLPHPYPHTRSSGSPSCRTRLRLWPSRALSKKPS